MFPRDIVPERPAKKHLLEDDHTFLPPALSSYSIALLNDRTSQSKPPPQNPHITGIYDLDFPQSGRNKLKEKLSMHFRESAYQSSTSENPFLRSSKSSNEFQPDPTNDVVNPNANTSITSSYNQHSNHSMSHPGSDRNLSHNSVTKLSNYNANLSNHHMSLSNHNTNNLSEQASDPLPTTNPSTYRTASPQVRYRPSSENSLSDRFTDRIMPPVKRLRGPKRFGKLIGPPQRVVRTSVDTPSPVQEQSKRPSPSSNEFDLSFLDKDKELELRKRIEEQKKLNELESRRARADAKAKAIKALSTHEEPVSMERIRNPLVELPPSQNNIARSDDNGFRKPKLPRPSPVKEKGAHDEEKENMTPVEHKPHPPRKKAITINNVQYEKLELLGRGGTSKVYKVKSLVDNRLYAIKKVTFDQFDDACIKCFKGEIDLLLKLRNNARVVQLVDYAIGEGQIYLVMECGEIDLSHVLHNRLKGDSKLDLNFVKFYATELLTCVQTVHQAEIVHSDLKPANFLFVRGVLKIIDFGIADSVPDHTANVYRDAQIGTPNYMAPEAWVNSSTEHKNTWKVSKPSDIWSCGCIIYQMIYGKPPYGKYSGNQRIMAVLNPQVKIQYPSKGIGGVPVPTSAIELMENCLARIPNDRWTVDRCLTSDFLKPKVVSENFIRDLVHSAVNFGYNNRANGTGIISTDVYDKLVETVMRQIEELNFS
ncbi:kinase-like protein [Yamadazyma tenuis ATCC 10573]|uniref:Kinase-like protein n=1 Tax=Candida tenuis (strain ATCC 10573 / BCRC 21748 / CBS 615 / JCM 9827 / NBRC 10315 / NRRL Y-1498 / VKM Y-70) TaxID=590646 RepID=G3AXQ7_CANTC|nr:kinase-like protein [Yamadazyma tenuis ATCC 10573]EGV65672.1 kinase-like protein [Yamadazyma tenuis ATCC 10573]